MKLSGLNHWLTLITNFGVLIGIGIVVIELRQNEVSMQAEASTVRTQMAINNEEYLEDVAILSMPRKPLGEYTEEELRPLRFFTTKFLRYLENLHYQNQLGILDDEIWQANLNGINNICEGVVTYLPDILGDNPSDTFVYRASFIDLLRSTCVR